MKIWPVLLDRAIPFADGDERSLLFAPLGTQSLLADVRWRLQPITKLQLTIVSPWAVSASYRARVNSECPQAPRFCTPDGFNDAFSAHDLSDALLIVDPRWLPLEARQLTELLAQHVADQGALHHLVAFEQGVQGTRERVSFDADGRIKGIRRHYEPVTWPFIAGVSATILPLACGAVGQRLEPVSLLQLRATLATRGIPGHDRPIESGAIDLFEESGLLAANEHLVLNTAAEQRRASGAPTLIGQGHAIHESARLIGRVVVHPGAVIEQDATIIGPAVVGAEARIGAGATVAHAVIGARCVVPETQVVHDRVWFGQRTDPGRAEESREVPFTERLARLRAERPGDARLPSSARPYVRLKRALDVCIAAVSLLVLAPVMAIVSLCIALQFDGPAFYGDEREGLNGRTFKCWKFRSMSAGAHLAQKDLGSIDQVDGPHFKIASDPRVTRLGRILRASNLDELPQLFNVLVGEMSLVGPRPSPFRENQVCVPWREARISVRPGISGLWQVCRHDREAGDFHQWIEYDVLYVQHMSLLLDIKIVAATLLTLAGKLTHVRPSWLIREERVDVVAA